MKEKQFDDWIKIQLDEHFLESLRAINQKEAEDKDTLSWIKVPLTFIGEILELKTWIPRVPIFRDPFSAFVQKNTHSMASGKGHFCNARGQEAHYLLGDTF